MRGVAGATGTYGDVLLKDFRRNPLRELLLDLSKPGLCLVLGAGASYGQVPMTPQQMADVARECIEAEGKYSSMPGRYLDYLEHPEVRFVTDLLRRADRGAWDRILSQFLSPGQANFVLHDMFTPRGEIPPVLYQIYGVFENARGVIVSYNYDRITDHQKHFRVIAPHGQRSNLLSTPRTRDTAKELAFTFGVPVSTDWWLPVTENEQVRIRHEYQEALKVWRSARTIVFIGYGFGGGADLFSFEDFGANAAPSARIHVLNPDPDLSSQVGYALKGRGPGFRVWRQPFRWRPFAEAVLAVLNSVRAKHIRHAVGREPEIGLAHDKRC